MLSYIVALDSFFVAGKLWLYKLKAVIVYKYAEKDLYKTEK